MQDVNPSQPAEQSLTSLKFLHGEREKLAAALSVAKKRVEQVDQAIADLVSVEIERERKAAEKEYGTQNVLFQGLEVKSTISRTVKWDTDKLETLVPALEELGVDPADYIDYQLTVSETKFNKLPVLARNVLEAARTTKYGKEKLVISEPK